MKFATSVKSKLKESLKVQQFENMKFKDSIVFIKVYSSTVCNGNIYMQKEEQRNNDIPFLEIVYKRIKYVLTLIFTIAKIEIIQNKIDFNKFAGHII